MAGYELYSMEKPGRPRLAIAMSAGLLLLTVALAYAMVVQRRQETYVPLGVPEPVADGWVSLPRPVGWEPGAREDVPPDIGLVLREKGGRGRTLAVVRTAIAIPSLRLRDAGVAVGEAADWLAGTNTVPIPQSVVSFGELPGRQFRWRSVAQRSGGGESTGVVTVTPQGRVLAVLLHRAGRIDVADEDLVRRVAAAAKASDWGLSEDVAGAAARVGMRFESPRGARVLKAGEGAMPWLFLVGPSDADGPWSIEMIRVPLAPDRKPTDVLADAVRDLCEQWSLPGEPERITLQGRVVFRMVVPADEEQYRDELWVAPTGRDSCVLIHGRFDGPRTAAQAACGTIAASVELTEGRWIADVDAAFRRGEEILEQIRSEGLDRWFEAERGRERIYLIEVAGQPQGYRRVKHTRQPSGAGAGTWRMTVFDAVAWFGATFITYEEQSVVEPRGVGYVMSATKRRNQPVLRALNRSGFVYQYEERRSVSSDVVNKTLVVGGDVQKRQATADATFASGPCEDVVCWLVASDPERRPAAVTVSSRFLPEPAPCYMRPLGALPIPGDAHGRQALAVAVQPDWSLSGTTLYFDEVGVLVAADFGRGGFMRASTEEECRERLGALLAVWPPEDLTP